MDLSFLLSKIIILFNGKFIHFLTPIMVKFHSSWTHMIKNYPYLWRVHKMKWAIKISDILTSFFFFERSDILTYNSSFSLLFLGDWSSVLILVFKITSSQNRSPLSARGLTIFIYCSMYSRVSFIGNDILTMILIVNIYKQWLSSCVLYMFARKWHLHFDDIRMRLNNYKLSAKLFLRWNFFNPMKIKNKGYLHQTPSSPQ